MKENNEEYIDFLKSINIKQENILAIISILLGSLFVYMKFFAISSILFAIRNSKINFFGNFSAK